MAFATRAKATYQRDGVIVLRRFMSRKTVGEVIVGLSHLLDNQLRRVGRKPAAADAGDALSRRLVALFRADRSLYFDTMRLAQHLPALQAFAGGERICRLAQGLGLKFPVVSTRQVLNLAGEAIRIPDGYDRSPAHQDWRYNQGSLDALTVWVALTDVGASDFPLEVVPGSHRAGLMEDGPHPFGSAVTSRVAGQHEFVPMTLRAGDALAFSAFLLHRTGEGRGRRVRIAASFRLNNADEADYIARGYFNPYAYKVDLSLRSQPSADLLRLHFPRPLRRGSA